MNTARFILAAFLLFASAGLQAQDKPSLKASVDKNRILLGESMKLTIEARLSTSQRFPVIDTIPHFEFADRPQIDSSMEGKLRKIVGIYTLTSFDSGHWVIPSFAADRRLKTDTIPVDIVFSEFDPSADYHDIKDIIPVVIKKQIPGWWYAAGAGLVLLLVMAWLLLKRKKQKPARPLKTINAYEQAIKELDELRRSKPAPKIFHSRLTNIFRLYLSRRKGIRSLQKTTDDLVLQIRNLELGREPFERLSQSLRLSDFVKFAKYIPSGEDDQEAFNTIRDSIMRIEKTMVASLQNENA